MNSVPPVDGAKSEADEAHNGAKVTGESRVSIAEPAISEAPESSRVFTAVRFEHSEADVQTNGNQRLAGFGIGGTKARGDMLRSPSQSSAGYIAAKRLIDILGAGFGLVLLMPVIFAVGAMIVLDSGGPVFHRRRVLESHPYDEETPPRTFDAFKFRTMVPNADAVLQSDSSLLREYSKEFKLRNDPRVTRIGRLLRRTSLDEIPQLVNVLRGQMTLVGPRMISPPELTMYGPHAALLLTVKPGLTGLWQVSGRQNISYTERVRLDLWYIENRSILLDLQILARTIGTVLARRGAF